MYTAEKIIHSIHFNNSSTQILKLKKELLHGCGQGVLSEWTGKQLSTLSGSFSYHVSWQGNSVQLYVHFFSWRPVRGQHITAGCKTRVNQKPVHHYSPNKTPFLPPYIRRLFPCPEPYLRWYILNDWSKMSPIYFKSRSRNTKAREHKQRIEN